MLVIAVIVTVAIAAAAFFGGYQVSLTKQERTVACFDAPPPCTLPVSRREAARVGAIAALGATAIELAVIGALWTRRHRSRV
jgi:hypothetical protein